MPAARRVLLIVLAAATLAAAGCADSGTDSGSSAPTSRSAATPTASSQPAGSSTLTASSRPAGASTLTTGVPGQRRWTTTAKAGTNQPRVPEHMPLLTDIRTGRHAGYDRVVLQFDNDLPSWQARYVSQVSSESGEAVPLAGQAFLRVDVHPAWGHDQRTPPYEPTYTGPRILTPSYPTLIQVQWVEEFEGYLTFGLGLSRRAGFRVLELRRPARLTIAMAH
jgi:hypothetical protein